MNGRQTCTPGFTYTGEVTAIQRAFFAENGFIVYRGMVTASEVAALRADVTIYHQRVTAGEIPPEHVDTVAPVSFEPTGTAIHHRLNYLSLHCPNARRIAHRECFVALRDAFIGPGSWLLEDAMNGVVWQMKAGGATSAYSAMRWHLDFPKGHTLSPVVTVSIYLDDSTRVNGCVALIPKSHRFPVGVCAPDPLYVELSAGDVLCHHERILHGSQAIVDPRGKRSTVYLYLCGGDRPEPGLPFADPRRIRSVRRIFVGAPSTRTASNQ